MYQRVVEFIVGLFVFFAVVCLIFLAFRVSGLTSFSTGNTYKVTAQFNEIGGLKVRAPVSISGVVVGQVTDIQLDPQTFKALVSMNIENKQNKIPVDSSASIFTEGLLGANYVSLMPGYEEKSLENDSTIETTHSAIILENLISQFLFNVKK